MDDSAYKEVESHVEAMKGSLAKSNWQEIGGINGRFEHLNNELRTLECNNFCFLWMHCFFIFNVFVSYNFQLLDHC